MDVKTARPKIRYYGIPFTNDNPGSWINRGTPFARYDTSEIFDMWDCNSSHEIIHTLVNVKNSFFAEGVAQCFQYEGNMNYKEQNANLNMSYQVKSTGTTNFMNHLAKYIANSPDNYYIPASFVYYNVEVLNNDAQFATFLKSLSFDHSVQSIQNKYKKATGREMVSVVAEWENWLTTIDENSDIYIEW